MARTNGIEFMLKQPDFIEAVIACLKNPATQAEDIKKLGLMFAEQLQRGLKGEAEGDVLRFG